MDHEFDLAFELLDTAIDRLQLQQYGSTTIEHHNHGDDLILTSRHTYSSSAGHKLTLLATYKDSGPPRPPSRSPPPTSTPPRRCGSSRSTPPT